MDVDRYLLHSFHIAMSAMRFILAALCWAVRGDLHAAVRANDPTQLQAALDAGEDINVIGPGGQTPLMHGVLTGSAELSMLSFEFFPFRFWGWGVKGMDGLATWKSQKMD